MQKLIECVPNFLRVAISISFDITGCESGRRFCSMSIPVLASTDGRDLCRQSESCGGSRLRGIQKPPNSSTCGNIAARIPHGRDRCLPVRPNSNVSWEEAIAAQMSWESAGEELNIPVYLYEKAAKDKSRSNLAIIRAGE
jgi:glutamate formiminotransferase/formiminotetrahydrofolate cyclodeaminase